MPANILADMNSLGPGLEDQRALQIALELTKLGLNENDTSPPPSTTGQSAQYESEASMMRKSANMTECVPVPSSEHVAEIVGRQGCKIKALRAKTNTYIKTPVRGEEPVFVVTGRKEDVCSAKREILSAAEHFSQIRASRRNNNTATPGLGGPGQPAPSLPGQVTIQVRVPYRVVGLVVGPKGATIKRIQQQTHTYIVTPNRDKEPIFEVTGLPENVDKARQEIEGHIAMRTGGMVDTSLNNHINNVHNSNMPMGPPKPGLDECRSDFHTNGVDAGFHEISTNLLFSSMYNNKSPSLTSAFTPYNKASVAGPGLDHGEPATAPVFGFSAAHEAKLDGPQGPGEGGMSSGGLYDSDEGIGGSPTFESTTLPITSASIWSDLGSDSQGSDVSALFSSRGAGGIAPCLSMGGPMCLPGELPSAQRPDPLSLACTLALLTGSASVTSSAPPSGDSTVTTSSLSSAASSPAAPSPTGPRPTHCLVCQHADVTAALVPCGHNMFCMTCANKLVSEPDKHCPLCQQQPSQAIRIFS